MDAGAEELFTRILDKALPPKEWVKEIDAMRIAKVTYLRNRILSNPKEAADLTPFIDQFEITYNAAVTQPTRESERP